MLAARPTVVFGTISCEINVDVKFLPTDVNAEHTRTLVNIGATIGCLGMLGGAAIKYFYGNNYHGIVQRALGPEGAKGHAFLNEPFPAPSRKRCHRISASPLSWGTPCGAPQ